MKNMRIPLLIAWGVAVIGIILGSFFDLSISKAIASASNGLGLTLSAIGPTLGFAFVALMGGGFVAFGLKDSYHIALRVIFFVLAAACIGVSIYYPGGEYFGINGFYGSAPEWAGYLIVLLPEVAAGVGGYFLFRNCGNKNMWIVFVIVIACLCLILLAIITSLKGIMHRPRFRFLAEFGREDLFHNWFEPCKNYKDLIEQYKTSSDNFKSFPSGHTAEASIVLVAATFYPLADKRFAKYQLPCFIGGGILVLIVAFARILAAAHFLSDVSFGAFVTITVTLIANEVVMRVKALHVEEAPVKE